MFHPRVDFTVGGEQAQLIQLVAKVESVTTTSVINTALTLHFESLKNDSRFQMKLQDELDKMTDVFKPLIRIMEQLDEANQPTIKPEKRLTVKGGKVAKRDLPLAT